MINEDTKSLLRECNSGTQMAVHSISEILEKVKSKPCYDILFTSLEKHKQLGNELHILLQKCGEPTKDPGTMAKSMSWLKTNTKLLLDDSDRVCAALIVDGCHMGIKSIQQYYNKYIAADKEAKQLAEKLIQLEEKLADDLKPYL